MGLGELITAGIILSLLNLECLFIGLVKYLSHKKENKDVR